MEATLETLKRLVTEVPISDWPPSVLLAAILYLIGFGGACAFSIMLERHEPYRGATIFHLDLRHSPDGGVLADLVVSDVSICTGGEALPLARPCSCTAALSLSRTRTGARSSAPRISAPPQPSAGTFSRGHGHGDTLRRGAAGESVPLSLVHDQRNGPVGGEASLTKVWSSPACIGRFGLIAEPTLARRLIDDRSGIPWRPRRVINALALAVDVSLDRAAIGSLGNCSIPTTGSILPRWDRIGLPNADT
jgi:hypothetical protein